MAAVPPANAAVSPLSLHVALGLLAAGAGGATRDHFAATMGGDGPGAAEASTRSPSRWCSSCSPTGPAPAARVSPSPMASSTTAH